MHDQFSRVLRVYFLAYGHFLRLKSRTLYKLFPFYYFFSDNENDFVISCPNVIVLANLILPTSFLTRNDVLLTWLVNFTRQGGLTEKITRVGVFFLTSFFFLPRFQRPQKTVFGFNTSWVNFEHHHQFSGLSVNVHDLFDKHYIRYHETFATYV